MRKKGWLFFTTTPTIMMLKGRTQIATRVMDRLMDSIMQRTPIIIVTLLTIWERLWFRVWVMVSTSLVMRLKTSP